VKGIVFRSFRDRAFPSWKRHQFASNHAGKCGVKSVGGERRKTKNPSRILTPFDTKSLEIGVILAREVKKAAVYLVLFSRFPRAQGLDAFWTRRYLTRARRFCTRITVTECHSPPAGVGILRSFNTAATARVDNPASSTNTGRSCSVRSRLLLHRHATPPTARPRPRPAARRWCRYPRSGRS